MRAPDTVSSRMLVEAMRKRMRAREGDPIAECLCDRCIYPARTLFMQLVDKMHEDECPNRVSRYIEKNPGCLQRPSEQPPAVSIQVPTPEQECEAPAPPVERFDLIRHQFPNWDRK